MCNRLKWALGLCLALLSVSEGLAQLSINEVQTANNVTIADSAGEYDDWIEIYNAGGAVDLAGYYISDDPADPLKFQIPAGTPALTTIPANGFLLLWADDDKSQGNNHLNFKLSSGGETILLSDPNEVLLDTMVVPALAGDTSRGLSPDGGSLQQVFATATPNASNGTGVPQASSPVITPASSVQSGSFTVSINVPSGTTIRYTIDGSDPVIDGQPYTGPFVVTTTSVVRAIGRASGFSDSPEDYAAYLVDPPHDLTVVMLTTDPDNLYDPQFGIYTVGANGTIGPCDTSLKNWHQDWQRPGNIVVFEPNGDVAFAETCELEISGGCSRNDMKKSLNIGFDQAIDYKLFDSRDETKWYGLKLRTGGNRLNTTRISDAFVQSVFEDQVDLDQQAWRPAAVYLNGEYWGYYTIRERLNKKYIKTHYPHVDDMDLIKLPGNPGLRHWIYEDVKEGTRDHFHSYTQFLGATDFTVQSNYEQVRDYLDVESFIDYGLVQVFQNNWDWPGNNMRAWRPRSSSGRWRYLLSDIGDVSDANEAPLVVFNEIFITLGDPDEQRNQYDTLPYRVLSKNQDYRNEFAQRTATYLATFWSLPNIDQKLADIIPLLGPEMDRDAARWPGKENQADWNISMADLRQFYVARPETFRSLIQQHFLGGVNDRFNLTVDFNASQGQVVLHGNHFKIQSGHTGEYYRNVPIRTRAVAKPGYRFLQWNGLNIVADKVNPGLYRSYNTANKTIEAVFEPGALDLVVNEVHYNPLDTNGAEFVELYNPDTHAKYIGGHTFTNGLRFTFPSDAMIAPGEYIVVAREPARYAGNGYQVFGPFDGALDDGGETLALATPFGDSVFVTEYNDGSTWPEGADGWGSSLELVTPLADPTVPSNWQASFVLGGTPGAPNSSASGVVINEVMARAAQGGDWIELRNTSNAAVNLAGWFISDDVFNPGRYQIPSGTLAAGGLLRFTEAQLGFGFGDDDTDVVLARGSGGIATGLEDVQDLSASMPGRSRGRHLRSDGLPAFPPMQTATQNAPNSAPYAGPLRITELMVEPVIGKGEYIKLTNVSGLPLDLYDPVNGTPWTVTGGIDFAFPLPTRVEACESIYITSETPAAFKVQYGLPFSAKVYGPWTGKLNNGGESIKLREPAPQLAAASVPIARIRVTQNCGDHLNIREIQAFDGAGVNVALFGSAAASSTYPGSSPGGVNDDDLSSGCCGALWSSAHRSGGEFVEITLPTPRSLSRVDVLPRIGCCPRLGDYILTLYDVDGMVVFTENRVNAGGCTDGGGNDADNIFMVPNSPSPTIPMALVEKVHYYDSTAWPIAPVGSVLVRQPGSGYSGDPATWSVAAPDPANVPCEDFPPVLNAPAALSIPEQAPYQQQLVASDPEGDPFLFSLSGNVPAGASISSTGLFTWTPSNAQGGSSYTFDVIISEQSAVPRNDQASWTITVLEVNDPPVLTTPTAVTIPEQAPFQQQFFSTDPEGTPLAHSLSANAPTGALISQTGLFIWTPSNAQGPGSYTFDVIVTELSATPLSDQVSWTITVLDVNDPPVLSSPAAVSIPEQALFQRQISATDPEGDPIAYALVGAPAGASISSSGLFSWTPSNAQGGSSYTFEVVVTEANATAEEDRANWTITVDDVNDPPVFVAASHSDTLTEHTVWTWQVPGVSDPDGDPIALSLAAGPPSGLVLDPATGWLRWLPGESTGGSSVSFDVLASDPFGGTATMNVNLSILERTSSGPFNTPCVVTNQLVLAGSSWNWSQTEASNRSWAEPWFDDSAWTRSPSPLGFNQGDEATVLQEGFARSTFRQTFQVTDVENILSLTMEVNRDDAFVAYLNGVEIARDNLPGGVLTSSTLASSSVFGATERFFYPFTIPASLLAEGDNTLALAVHQVAVNSNDMIFNLKLHATKNADCTLLRLDPNRLVNAGVISWQAIPGEQYVVECCEDLVIGNWTTVSTVTASASIEEVVDPAAPSEMRRFYRIKHIP